MNEITRCYIFPSFKDITDPTCKEKFVACNSTDYNPFDLPETQCWTDFAVTCARQTPRCGESQDLIAIVILVIAILSFVGNTIVCVVFCLYEQLRLVKHYFVINLAVVDNILAVISIPMFAAYILGDKKDVDLCRAQIMIDVLCGTASIVSLAVISIERYVAVVLPLHYEQLVTQYRAVVIIIFTWFYSALVTLILLLSYAIPSSPAFTDASACVFFGGEFVILVAIASFIFPVGVMTWSYWNIFVVAHAHARQIQAMVPSNLQPADQSGNARPQVRMRGELKAAKTLTSIMATHIICWCPLFVYFVVISYCSRCENERAAQIVNYIIMVLRYCNSLTNPIIYTGINRQFRGAIKKFVLRKRGNEELNVTVYTQAA